MVNTNVPAGKGKERMMYRPPENSNRVRAMKLKFESQDSKNEISKGLLVNAKPKNTKSPVVLNESAIRSLSEGEAPALVTVNKSDSTNSDTLPPQTLNRQLSDPARRNIKRTPAFRLDKNTFIEREHTFQRQSSQNNIQTKVDKLKMLNDSSRLKMNCDNIENINLNNNNINISTNQIKFTYKSKSVDEIKNQLYTAFNQKKINNTSNAQPQHTSVSDADQSIGDNKNISTSALYASPIPKSLRNKTANVATDNFYADSHHNKTYERDKNKIETAQNVIEILKNIDLQQYNGSDTIKSALKRPLPPGPAPKKPPRTFQHAPQNHLDAHSKASSKSETNIASLNLEKAFTKELNKNLQKKLPMQTNKRDPKYMLEKLESALKNNKLRVQRQQKVDYNSEDEVEVKSKSSCSSPLLKRFNDCTNTLASSNFNLNCFPSLGCSKSAYTRIKEPNSSFFVDGKTDEPVYAEPFQHSPAENENDVPEASKTENTSGGENVRNSLYYMSSPVVGLDLPNSKDPEVMNTDDNEMVARKEQQCGDTSSVSTVSLSDTDSNASLPSEVNNGNNIKDLIKSFEERNGSFENDPKHISNITRKKKLAKTRKANKLDSSERGNGAVHSDMEENDLSADEKKSRCMSKFEIYVKTVRGFSISKLDNKNLFHCCLLVGLDDRCPYIKSKFPSNVAIPVYIEKFCFPDSEDQRVNYSSKEQNYSLVITDSTGERIYGYCRRVLPEGSCTCLPLAYCILARNRAPRFYKRILQELESHHGIPDKQRDLLMNEFYKFEFPKPGHTIKINLSKIITNDIKCYVTETGQSNASNNNSNRSSSSSDILTDYYLVDNTCRHGFLKDRCQGNSNDCELCVKESSEIVLTLHQDSRYEETDLKELCETLDVTLLQKVFENLLIERKVIFISCHLSKLSACIEAIQSILYPFSWPHAFIPVLPKSRWEIVEAPAPLICGVLSLSVVNDFKIDHAITVDLDANEVLQEMQDDMKILPASSVKIWKKGLELANSVPEEDYGRNVLLGDAFIRVFINTCGHYKEFITNGVFDRDGFKNFPKGKGTRHFLQWFTETTMFNIFIESVVSNPDSFNVFDSRIKIYNSQDATSILEKMKGWRKD